MRHLDVHVTKQLIVGETPPLVGIPCLGIGPLRMRGSAYMEGPVLIGQPQAYPTPMLPEATFMLSPGLNFPDSPKQVSIFKVTNKFTLNAAAPNPLDIMLGDPIIGTVGITINASVINTIVDTLHNYVCPITNWVGILNHTGIENLMGAKNLIGSEIIAAIKAQVGAEVRAGGKCTNGGMVVNGALAADTVAAFKFIGDIRLCSGKKNFDISHPTKKDHRLRHVCVEGPTADVYVRGNLKDKNVIELPDYWKGLVDPETIDVSLTPFGSYQELYVESIQWGQRIVVKNSSGGPINCSYIVYGERNDGEKNIPEYQGLTPDDYPGDNSEYNINT